MVRIHEMIVRKANRGDPDQTADLGLCAVCLCPFGRQHMFKMLAHLSQEQ